MNIYRSTKNFGKRVLLVGTLIGVLSGCDKEGIGSPADPKQEFWAEKFPGSIRAKEFDDKYGTNYSGRRNASRDMSARDVSEAKWGRGSYAGKTGDPFVDDPFF